MSTGPQRLTAMHHAQLEMGAVMDDADGWQLPDHYGDPEEERRCLVEAVGVSDVSPIGKIVVVGDGADGALTALFPEATEQAVGSVSEADSPMEQGEKLLSVRRAEDEFLILTPTGASPAVIGAIGAGDTGCVHAVDVTSGLCGVAITGPLTQELMSRITDVNTSLDALRDLGCVQSRFVDVQGLLLRRDVGGIAVYQLYAGREFGEYLWDVLVETARELGGGPVGTRALLGLRQQV